MHLTYETPHQTETSVKFQRAQSEHAPALERLYRQGSHNPQISVSPWTVDSISHDLNNQLFIGQMNGLIVATAFLILVKDVMFQNQPYAIIENLIVDEERRNRGIGTQFLFFLKNLCQSYRCTKMIVLSHDSQTQLFFENLGYQHHFDSTLTLHLNPQMLNPQMPSVLSDQLGRY